MAAGCLGGAAEIPSAWPPADFQLVVEQLGDAGTAAVVQRRFEVDADGVCVYAESATPLVDPISRTAIPVFDRLCAYRLRPEATRLLARKVHRRGVLELDPQQGDQRATDGQSLRLQYRAFGEEREIVASGKVHGSFVRVLHVVNAYLPPGVAFGMDGMAGDPVPPNLSGVPSPVTGVVGALDFFRERLEQQPGDPELLLDAFALACRAGERARAAALLQRWADASAVGATAAAPFSDPPTLLPQMLERLLPE